MEIFRDSEFDERTTQKLGKKQKNNLVDFGRKQIAILDDGARLDRDELSVRLGNFSYSDTFRNSGGTNLKRPEIVKAILGKSDRQLKERYLAGIGNIDDYLGIVAAATEVCTEAKPIVFRMVYGATEKAPLRSIGYPLPAMLAMKRLSEITDVPAYLQIVFAQNISTEINGLDTRKTGFEKREILRNLSRVSRIMGVHERVGYYDDGLVDISALQGHTEHLADTLSGEQLKTLSGKHGGSGLAASLAYVAAHHLVHDDESVELRHISHAAIPETFNIVDVGGKQEAYFLGMRDMMRNAYGIREPRAPFVFTRHSVPPYYMASDGDVGLFETLSSGFGACPTARSSVEASSFGAAALHDIKFMQRTMGLPAHIEPPIQPPVHGVSLHI